ncbi:hypothetical protein DP73_12600 [Desulfosporosinus sp. HMP52]|nr:hypothetical protein DP73_12600 [Desulfosporosinus sp. HMP52]
MIPARSRHCNGEFFAISTEETWEGGIERGTLARRPDCSYALTHDGWVAGILLIQPSILGGL